MNYALSKFIVRKRFLNKVFRSIHPTTLVLKLGKKFLLCIDPNDISGPSFYVAYSGESAFYHYEVNVKAAILRFLKSNGVFLDVGANIGLISLFIGKFRPDVKIFSFEPSDTTYSCLMQNIDLMKLSNIQVNKLGVSSKTVNGATFYIDNRSSGGNSMEESAIADVRSKINIDLITIDDFVKNNNIIPNVIKIDVQDHESSVLIGASVVIAKYRPTIIVETNNKILIERFSEVSSLFQNYLVSLVGKSDFVELSEWYKIAEQLLSRDIVTIDYVLTPKESL